MKQRRVGRPPMRVDLTEPSGILPQMRELKKSAGAPPAHGAGGPLTP